MESTTYHVWVSDTGTDAAPCYTWRSDETTHVDWDAAYRAGRFTYNNWTYTVDTWAEPQPLINEREAELLPISDLMKLMRFLLPKLTKGLRIEDLPEELQKIVKRIKLFEG